MFYKIIFSQPIEYDKINDVTEPEGLPVETQINQYTGLDSVIYSNSQIDLLLNSNGEIEGLQICNECTKTFNIENHLLAIASQLISGSENTAEVFDGSGFTEFMDYNTLNEYLT